MWFPYTLTLLGLGATQLAARWAWSLFTDHSTIAVGFTALFWMLVIGLGADGFVFLRERLRSARGRRRMKRAGWG